MKKKKDEESRIKSNNDIKKRETGRQIDRDIEEALNGAKNAGKPVTNQRVTITNFLLPKHSFFDSVFIIENSINVV